MSSEGVCEWIWSFFGFQLRFLSLLLHLGTAPFRITKGRSLQDFLMKRGCVQVASLVCMLQCAIGTVDALLQSITLPDLDRDGLTNSRMVRADHTSII